MRRIACLTVVAGLALGAASSRSYRGNISRVFGTPGGFRCTRVSGGQLGGQWRCAESGGPRAYRFEFGD